jgi:Domain of unknown function (DUF1772)
MLLTLEVVSMFLTAVAMSLALAHALEFPGKMRLNTQTYNAVQTIYYPGFTIGGMGEPLAAIATLILLIAMRHLDAPFWWAFAAFIAIVLMHAVFWLVTQPANKFWLRNANVTSAGVRFFGLERADRSADVEKSEAEWKAIRSRWEYSHMVRAVLACIAVIALAMAVAM